MVYRDREVEVPLPVRAPLDARLIADCEPGYAIPPNAVVTLDVVLRRLASVEDSLFLCRVQLEKLRQLENSPAPGATEKNQ